MTLSRAAFLAGLGIAGLGGLAICAGRPGGGTWRLFPPAADAGGQHAGVSPVYCSISTCSMPTSRSPGNSSSASGSLPAGGQIAAGKPDRLRDATHPAASG